MHRIMFRPHATWNTRYDFTGHGGQASSCMFRAARILGWRWRVPATGAAACQCGPFRCHAAALLHGPWAVCGSRGSRDLGVLVRARMETQWGSSECLVVLCPDPDAEAGASLAAWVWTWTWPGPGARAVCQICPNTGGGSQGLAQLGLQPEQVDQLLAHVANMAAHQSFVLGQLPPATEAAAATWLARVRCAACHPVPMSLR